MPVAICDSTVLIYLAKVEALQILPQLFDSVLVPQAVYDECVVGGRKAGSPDADVIDSFIAKQTISLAEAPPCSQAYAGLGAGESACLDLARQTHEAVFIADDSRARKTAATHGVPVKGTIGILLQAWWQGLLPAGRVRNLLDRLEDRPDVWLAPALIRAAKDRIEAGRKP